MTTNSWKDRVLRWFLYSVVGGATFFFSLNFFMDWELVKERVSSQMAKMTGYDVAIGEMRFGLAGITMEDVVLVSPPKKGEKQTRFMVASLSLKTSILDFIDGKKNVEFEAEALGGRVSGAYRESEQERTFSLDLNNVRISKLPMVRSAVSLPMKGRISMDGHVELGRHGWRKANGEFNITLKRVIVGDGKTTVKATFLMPPKTAGQATFQKDGFPLPPLSLGKQFSWSVEIKNGKAEIKDFVTSSKDGEAELVGTLKFRDPMRLSMADMYMKFKFSKEALERSDALEMLELSLKRRGKRSDGSFGLSVNGQIARLRFRPSRTGLIDRMGRSGRRGRRTRPPTRFKNRDRRRGPRSPLKRRDRDKYRPKSGTKPFKIPAVK